MSIKEIVEVDKAEYEELQRRVLWLEALEGAGVDNWDDGGVALDIYKDSLKEAGLKDPDLDDEDEDEDEE